MTVSFSDINFIYFQFKSGAASSNTNLNSPSGSGCSRSLGGKAKAERRGWTCILRVCWASYHLTCPQLLTRLSKVAASLQSCCHLTHDHLWLWHHGEGWRKPPRWEESSQESIITSKSQSRQRALKPFFQWPWAISPEKIQPNIRQSSLRWRVLKVSFLEENFKIWSAFLLPSR